MPGIAGEVANLIVALKLDDSGFTGKLNGAAKTLKGFDAPLSRMGRGVGQVSSGLLRLGERAAVAAAGGLTAVVTTAASFEQAFTGVEKTVDGTEAQLGELEETLRGMARSMPVSFEELASIGEAGGALGVARESLDEFIDVVARLAVSTDLSSDQAATALGQLGTVLDLSGSEFEDFADALVGLGNAGASTESQIVEMAARFAASGKQAGLSKEEILALASATASMGIEVEAGGTALSQTFDKITLAIATGSDEGKTFAKTMGLSAKEFRTAWERDALGTFQDFLRELSKLDRFEQAAVLDKAGITGIRQQRAVLLMTQNLGFLNEQLDVAEKSQGALREESDKFFDTAVGQWKTFVNVVRDGAAIIGEEVLPVTKDILEDLTGALDNAQTRNNLRDFGRDLASGIRGLVTELKGTDFSGIIGGMKIAAEVAKGAFDAFRSLPEPVQQLAIAALVANKVSGGAIGQIAKGLGNIVLGGAGLLGKFRGQTPANPLFVSVVGPGGLGGPIGGAGKAGGLSKLLFGVSAAGFAAVIADEVGPALADLGTEIHDAVGIPDAPDWLTDFLDTPIPMPDWAHDLLHDQPRSTSPQSSTPLGQFDPANRGGTPFNNLRFKGEVDDIPRVRDEIRALRDDNRSYDGADQRRFASLEQRLLKDKSFAQGLTPEKFLRLLARTSEFGEKGKGTSIEFGPTTGRDPFGKSFLALAQRIPEEHLKDRRVIGELERHIVAAEEVQADAIREGDIEGARKLQRTIDGIHALLGSEDKTRVVLNEGNRKQDETARRISDTRAAIHEQRQAFVSRLDTSNAKLNTIAGKDFSPEVSTNVTVNSVVSVSDVVRHSVTHRVASGFRGGNSEF